jgi:hypothetical protein
LGFGGISRSKGKGYRGNFEASLFEEILGVVKFGSQVSMAFLYLEGAEVSESDFAPLS